MSTFYYSIEYIRESNVSSLFDFNIFPTVSASDTGFDPQYSAGGSNLFNNQGTPFPGGGRPSLLQNSLGLDRSNLKRFDPASLLVNLMKIFVAAKKFTGKGIIARSDFVDFSDLLTSTLSSWASITAGIIPTTSLQYTIGSVLTTNPTVFENLNDEAFQTATEFSKIIFRLFMHICTDTALRLIVQDKETENGFNAFQRLKRRYANVTVSTIGDLENKINQWKWPSIAVDPQDAMLGLTELWNLSASYGLPVHDTQRVTFLISKLRTSPHKHLVAVWGGSNVKQFLSETSSEDIFNRVYENWEYLQEENKPTDDRVYLTGNTCRICKSPNCSGETTCPKRRCLRCGNPGHDINSCRTNLTNDRDKNHRTNDRNDRGNDRDRNKNTTSRPCSKCKSTKHNLADCPEVECHECHMKGHIRPNCPKLADRVNRTDDVQVPATGLEVSDSLFTVVDKVNKPTDEPSERRKQRKLEKEALRWTPKEREELYSRGFDIASTDDSTDSESSDDDSDLNLNDSSNGDATSQPNNMNDVVHAVGEVPADVPADVLEHVLNFANFDEQDVSDTDTGSSSSSEPISSLFPWLFPESDTSSENSDNQNNVPSYNDPENNEHTSVVSEITLPTLPLMTRFISDTISTVTNTIIIIKAFLIDSGSTRNICRNRDWFETDTFSTNKRYHLVLGGIVKQSDNTSLVTINTKGFGYVPLSTYLGLSNVIIDIRIPCYWSPDAADDVLSTDILKQGVNICIRSSSRIEDKYERVPLFFSTQSDSLYNEDLQIVIPLRSRITTTAINQGTGLVLLDCTGLGGAPNDSSKCDDDNTTADTTSNDVSTTTDVTVKSNICSISKSVYTQLVETTQVNFDMDVLNRLLPPYSDVVNKKSYAKDFMENHSDEWINGHYFAFPDFNELAILFLVRAALKCYLLAPLTTSFTFVLPVVKKSSWWSYVDKYFTTVMEIPAGTHSFLKKNTKTNKYETTSLDQPVIVVHLSRNSAISIDNWLLAHCRFNHIGGSALNKMMQSGVNMGLVLKESASFILCHVCNKCKATRPKLYDLTGKLRSKLPSPLHDLYMDIHGPLSPESTRGYRFIIGYICSATGYAFIYFLKRKSEAFQSFVDLITYLETHKNLPVRFVSSELTLTSDNANEFTSGEFKEFCATKQITHTLTSPYAHHQALFIERLWRTLADAARTMLATAGIEFKFWPLAWSHAVHVYRRVPHRTRDESTASESPHYKLFKIEPDLSHLRIFGSDAFPYIEKTAREGGKLTAPRAKYGIYVGHEANLQTVIILDPVKEIVYRAGLVHIVENVDKVGKTISNPDVSVASFRYADSDISLYERPKPFFAKKESFNKAELLDIQTWYSDNDKETYGIVQISEDSKDPIWTFVTNFLYFVLTESLLTTRDMFFAFLDLRFGNKTGVTNEHFPIFSRVEVVQNDDLFPGIIVSTDAHSKQKYGVIYYDESKPSVNHQDVTEGELHNFTVEILFSTTDYLSHDPKHRQAAMSRPDAAQWAEAERVECYTMFEDKKCLKSLAKSAIPANAVILPMRWVYKLKRNADGSLERYKARLVAKGYRQIPGLHFDGSQTFSPSASNIVFRLLITFLVTFRLYAYCFDVKSAFLNSSPKYTNYVSLPDGFSYNGSQYGLMLKNIYGTRDAARGWYEDQHTFLTRSYPSLVRSNVDPCLYYLFDESLTVFIIVTVDDYAVVTSSKSWYNTFFETYSKKYACKNLGRLSLYSGILIEISPSRSDVFLSQEREVRDLLQRFQMSDSNSARTPMVSDFQAPPRTPSETGDWLQFDYPSLVGSLLWIARMTRPDILFAVITLSAFMKTFTNLHIAAAKRILRYLHGTLHYGQLYSSSSSNPSTVTIASMSDADWGGDTITRRSTSGAITKLFDCYISCTCRRQDVIALSTTEAELIALTEAAKDVKAALNFMKEIVKVDLSPFAEIARTTISTDNIAAQFIANNRVFNNRTRHIDIRYMFIRDLMEEETINLDRVESSNNVADIFTKALSYETFTIHRRNLGVVQRPDFAVDGNEE